MDHNLRFVQFSHPGREHEPDPSGGKAWNTLNSQHARKFMEFGGKWIEDDGSARSGNLRAWGEWEAESDLVCELSQPHQYSQYPRYLWHPCYVPKDNYKWLHNTDPLNGCTTPTRSSSASGFCIRTANNRHSLA